MANRIASAGVYLLGICIAPALASATGPPLPPASTAPPPAATLALGFEWTLGLGVADAARSASSPQRSGWLASGATGAIGSLHWKHLRAGVVADFTGVIERTNEMHLGAVVGPTWEVGEQLRLEVLAELGANLLYGVGTDLWTRASGDSNAWLPFAGLRLSAAWHIRSMGLIGFWLSVREDLLRATVYPTLSGCFVFCVTSEEEWHAGGLGFMFGFRLGFEQ